MSFHELNLFSILLLDISLWNFYIQDKIVVFGLGLALLQRQDQSPIILQEMIEAPEQCLHEAAAFHPFAEAAYTVL